MKLLMSVFPIAFMAMLAQFSCKLMPPPINGTISVDGWRLDHFNKELFWEEPPEGNNQLML
jgi:hypothetical protein